MSHFKVDDEVRGILKRVIKESKTPLAKDVPSNIFKHSGGCAHSVHPIEAEIDATIDLNTLLEQAHTISVKNKSKWINLIHVVCAIYALAKGKMPKACVNRISAYLKTDDATRQENIRAIASLPGIDMSTRLETDSKVYGRNREIEELTYTLLRKKKSNPVLLGEAGTGKTAIVEEFTRRMLNGEISELNGYRVIELTLPSLIGGTNLRGTAERRLEEMIAVAEHENVILFIDEVHVVLNPNNINGSEISNIMKPALSRGKMKVIAATTLKEWKAIEKDGALARRFNKIMVEELDIIETKKLMIKCRDEYEKFHNVKVTDEMCEKIVELSDKYLTNKVQPDKSIDVLDVMMSELRCKANSKAINLVEAFVGANQIQASEVHILEAVSRISGVPVKNLSANEIDLLTSMHKEVEKHVIGQEVAIQYLLNEITKFKLKLTTREKPITFLLVGNTGTGKTLVVKTIASMLYGKTSAFIRFDMSEFRERHTTSRLIGSPPGFVGFEQGGELTESVKNNPYSIVLFDEIEKCHNDVKNILLQICGEGRLKDASGTYVDFSNTIITMTSNVGSNSIGDAPLLIGDQADEGDRFSDVVIRRVREEFSKEFIGRIDYMVPFNSKFTDTELDKVIGMEILKVADSSEIKVKHDKKVSEYFRKGYDAKEGLRSISKSVQNQISGVIKDVIVKERKRITEVSITVKDGKLEGS